MLDLVILNEKFSLVCYVKNQCVGWIGLRTPCHIRRKILLASNKIWLLKKYVWGQWHKSNGIKTYLSTLWCKIESVLCESFPTLVQPDNFVRSLRANRRAAQPASASYEKRWTPSLTFQNRESCDIWSSRDKWSIYAQFHFCVLTCLTSSCESKMRWAKYIWL